MSDTPNENRTTEAVHAVELIASAFCPAVIVDHGEPCPECIRKAGQVFRQLRPMITRPAFVERTPFVFEDHDHAE